LVTPIHAHYLQEVMSQTLFPAPPLPDDRKAYRFRWDDTATPAPGTSWLIRQVFTHFQNLNLRVLIEDLRRGRVAQGNWTFDRELCPVAHGLCDGRTVSLVQYISQAVDLKRACERAAEHIGASPRIVYHVVTGWDAGDFNTGWLLQTLEGIWAERQADAEAVQGVLCPLTPDPSPPPSLFSRGML